MVLVANLLSRKALFNFPFCIQSSKNFEIRNKTVANFTFLVQKEVNLHSQVIKVRHTSFDPIFLRLTGLVIKNPWKRSLHEKVQEGKSLKYCSQRG